MTLSATHPALQPSAAVSPEPIMKLASGFMAAKHLFAANELGLFEALGDSPATLDALAARTGLTRRAARISADAMVALGLLQKDDETYRNGPEAAQFLAGRTPADLRPFLRFWDSISYPVWQNLAQALSSGPPSEIFDLDEGLQEIASAGIEAVLAGPARALPQVHDFTAHSRLLDIGGGTGSWALAIAQQNPHLQATIFELPVVVGFANERIAAAGLQARVDAVVGDAMSGSLPEGYDVLLAANLLHYWSPEQIQAFLQRARASVAPGTTLLLADFWTDPTHTQPLHAALMAGEFAVHIEHGDVYSVEEIRAWLTGTGWAFSEHVSLAGPQSVIVATAD